MTQDEIKHDLLQVCKVKGWDGDFNILAFHVLCDKLKQLGAEEEREACAKACEKVAVDMFTQLGREHEPYMKATAEDCAMQIRARGQSQVCCEEYNTCVRPCTPRGRLYGQKEEREECAKVCDEFPAVGYVDKKLIADYHSYLIRQRGQA